MAVDIIFVGSILFPLLMLIGFYIKDLFLVGASSIGLMSMGVYILINGIASIINMVTLAIGAIFVCFGFYVLISSSLESI